MSGPLISIDDLLGRSESDNFAIRCGSETFWIGRRNFERLERGPLRTLLFGNFQEGENMEATVAVEECSPEAMRSFLSWALLHHYENPNERVGGVGFLKHEAFLAEACRFWGFDPPSATIIERVMSIPFWNFPPNQKALWLDFVAVVHEVISERDQHGLARCLAIHAKQLVGESMKDEDFLEKGILLRQMLQVQIGATSTWLD